MLKTPKIQIMDWSGNKSFSQRQLNFQKMSEPRMSTAICHLLLAGSSAWTCRTLYNASEVQWVYGTLGLYFAKSVVGVLRYGDAVDGENYADMYNKVEFFSIALGPSFFAADLYLHYGASQLLALIQAGFGSIPLLGYTHEPDSLEDSLHFIVCSSLFGAGIVGLVHDNEHALWSSVWYYLNLYFIKRKETIAGLSQHSARLDKAQDIITILYKSLGINLFLTDLYQLPNMNQNPAKYMPPLHLILGFVPPVITFIDSSYMPRDALLTIDIICVISGIYAGIVTDNNFAIGASCSYAILSLSNILDLKDVPELCMESIQLVILELLMACALTQRNILKEIGG